MKVAATVGILEDKGDMTCFFAPPQQPAEVGKKAKKAKLKAFAEVSGEQRTALSLILKQRFVSGAKYKNLTNSSGEDCDPAPFFRGALKPCSEGFVSVDEEGSVTSNRVCAMAMM